MSDRNEIYDTAHERRRRKERTMKLTIELDYTEYNEVSEALRLAAGNRIPNDTQRLALWKLNDRLTDAMRDQLNDYPDPMVDGDLKDSDRIVVN